MDDDGLRPGLRAGPVAVLVNPRAGARRAADLAGSVSAAVAHTGRRVRLLHAPDRAAALHACHEAVARGAAALVAVGGDGTVHLALQAVAGSDVALGIVPAGTGNDLAAALDLPRDPPRAAAAVGEALAARRVRPVDLVLVESTGGAPAVWYAGVLAAGFDALVAERANRLRVPRGPRRYDVAVLVELLRLRPRPYRIRIDGVESRQDAVLVAVGNTALYGGGMRICPAADPTDGLLDVLVGSRVGRATLLRLKARVRAGTHVHDPRVHVTRGRRVELEAPGITAHADGERLVPLPVTLTCVPGALRLLTP